MIDLSEYVQKVWASKSIEEKKVAATSLILNSHAKKGTKANALSKVARMTKSNDVDRYMADYSASGEGNKVIK